MPHKLGKAAQSSRRTNIIRNLCALLLAASAACSARADGVIESERSAKAHAQAPSVARAQIGRATYYHKTLRGMKTASGEAYDPEAMTAAHRYLKLGTYVRVALLRGKRDVIVKINDRLPPDSRAIIDLSTAAARKLGIIHRGVAKVKVELLTADEIETLLNTQ